ncbi:MAG: orotate phosphoribosyltransferase [Candidatus Omnitrophica bacterium]|nr:orotate phosphoribosyltransferase [Candidatus Omnitrophota bacterium]MDD5351953.1 orotate phosphoribosyltransferase [Candidatus Omnitrophota bacterium]MDD5550779.1 orotate phosphoribosyltransferase [Candidatus Omnitrophota bacterium]
MRKINKAREELFKLIKSQAYSEGRFVLSSGKISSYYIDCRKVTLTSRGAYLAALVILDIIKNKKIDAVGGPTIGADPIVGAVSVLSLVKHNKPIKAFLVRKSAKSYGAKRQIEGPRLTKGCRVVVVDDVATTGGSLIETLACLRKQGIKTEMVVVLVDRNEGAKQALKKAKCKFVPIFNIKDFRNN